MTLTKFFLRPARMRWSLSFLLGCALFAGCHTPIGADLTSTRRAYHQVTANVLHGELSDPTRLVLHRFDWEQRFHDDPSGTLKLLHDRACADDRRDLLYALAELNFAYGDELQNRVKPSEVREARDYFLASAIYAWFYLLGEGADPPPGPYERRFRVACDLYNRAVAGGFAIGPMTNSVIRPETALRMLGPGCVQVQFSKPAFHWDRDEIESFLPADDFTVRGLTTRDRQSGLGAPLIAVARKQKNYENRRRLPATLLLRAPGNVSAWSRGELSLSLELYSSFETNSVVVNGQTIPLEADVTAPLAHGLNDSSIWKIEYQQFFSPIERVKSDIYLTNPYEPGKIPVIFVHGTVSSPIWWAEMWNTLRADPRMRARYQFWSFIYNSGNPVTYSAANLRDAIERKIKNLDPEGRDPALRRMVVIGHSQGGLLTKLTATDTGDKLWRAAEGSDFEKLKLDPKDREAVRRCFFFQPLPSVQRVVFISTPHRGSYRSTSFVRRFAYRFMALPADVVRLSTTLLKLKGPGAVPSEVNKFVPTSLDTMSPDNKMMLALAEIPVAPGVKCHTIAAIKGDDLPPEGGDGVVMYRSAHVDYADSEFIARSGHSCQEKPLVIEEVRRILLEHLAVSLPAGPPSP